jgi:hypothetical protein
MLIVLFEDITNNVDDKATGAIKWTSWERRAKSPHIM